MLTYELAKKLKEAGFPTPQTLETLKVEKFRPTLPELIEACGVCYECDEDRS